MKSSNKSTLAKKPTKSINFPLMTPGNENKGPLLKEGVGSRKVEDGGRRTEDRSQRSEGKRTTRRRSDTETRGESVETVEAVEIVEVVETIQLV
jgi:hypothetical protein